jgi:hypothetical protein
MAKCFIGCYNLVSFVFGFYISLLIILVCSWNNTNCKIISTIGFYMTLKLVMFLVHEIWVLYFLLEKKAHMNLNKNCLKSH